MTCRARATGPTTPGHVAGSPAPQPDGARHARTLSGGAGPPVVCGTLAPQALGLLYVQPLRNILRMAPVEGRQRHGDLLRSRAPGSTLGDIVGPGSTNNWRTRLRRT